MSVKCVWEYGTIVMYTVIVKMFMPMKHLCTIVAEKRKNTIRYCKKWKCTVELTL